MGKPAAPGSPFDGNQPVAVCPPHRSVFGVGFGACPLSRALVMVRRRSTGSGPTRPRRGGRVVDRAALEMRSTGNRTGGSNPSLSASFRPHLIQPGPPEPTGIFAHHGALHGPDRLRWTRRCVSIRRATGAATRKKQWLPPMTGRACRRTNLRSPPGRSVSIDVPSAKSRLAEFCERAAANRSIWNAYNATVGQFAGACVRTSS